MYQFRDATEQDYEQICALFKSREELFRVYPAGEFPLTPSQLVALAKVRKALTVVLNGGHVIGFANLYDFEPDEYAFIGNVVVAHEYRGKGLGKEIVAYMLDQAYNNYDLPEVRLSVFSENTPAILLYSDFGFTPYEIEERIDSDNTRVALVHMRLKREW